MATLLHVIAQAYTYPDTTQVKQRRLEREAERAAREGEAAAAARAREALQFHTWARQEDAFHLHQARLRSQIRIRDGRGTTTKLTNKQIRTKTPVSCFKHLLCCS